MLDRVSRGSKYRGALLRASRMPFCGTVVRDYCQGGGTPWKQTNMIKARAPSYKMIQGNPKLCTQGFRAYRALNPKPIDPSKEAACRASTTARAIMERLPPLPGKTDLSFWYIASGESGLRV